eukprot:15485600-Alexandrium_andersonii.AAC.1
MAGRAAAFHVGQGAASSSSPGPPTKSRLEPDGGVGLRKYLLQQYHQGKLSAYALCTTAFHATKAGAANMEDLAMDPTGSHQAERV